MRSVYRAAARVRVQVDIRTVTEVNHTGLQGKQFWHISRLKREFLYLTLSKGDTQRSIGRVQGHRRCRNLDDVRGRAYF